LSFLCGGLGFTDKKRKIGRERIQNTPACETIISKKKARGKKEGWELGGVGLKLVTLRKKRALKVIMCGLIATHFEISWRKEDKKGRTGEGRKKGNEKKT